MKYCPYCSRPIVREDGCCSFHGCPGYPTRGGVEKMQEHADRLTKEKGVYLEGWTRKQEPEKPSRSMRQPATGKEVN